MNDEEFIQIKIGDVKKRIQQMKPNADMNDMHYTYFEGYVNALKWVLDD